MKRIIRHIGFIVLALSLWACSEPIPKPRGYFRIELPEKNYSTFQQEGFPCRFEYPDNVSTVYTKSMVGDSAWVDVVYPKHKARIYCTYKRMNGNFQQLSEDSRRLVYKPHTAKADAISEQLYENEEHRVYGVLYELKGNTASNIQFTLTDSVDHFFRGSLYFSVNPNKDSIAPVVNYIREDIIRMIETLEWK